jgi:hypothetical protein
MALIDCPECKNQMSNTAEAVCPKCGFKRPGATQGIFGCLLIIGGLILGAIGLSIFGVLGAIGAAAGSGG